MSHTLPEFTFELSIAFPADSTVGIKELVKSWLQAQGVTSFVEGAVDNLDINPDYANPDEENYETLGGLAAPISIYKYECSYLEDLQTALTQAFGQQIRTVIHTTKTEGWVEGWKESFQPIVTQRYYIYPPWRAEALPTAKIPICIEPGMAFGTGQHATSRLCLEALEALTESMNGQTVADVGTGTGILAIAAAKVGGKVRATDIDLDAVRAATTNCQVNDVEVVVSEGSVPAGTFGVVMANILTVVLKGIFSELVAAVEPGGTLLLSGILVEERSDMCRLAEEAGLASVAAHEADGWVALCWRKEIG